MSLSDQPERRILRYRIGPRIIHALLASSYLILLATGFLFLAPPLAQSALGPTSRLLHRIGAVMFMLVPVAYIIFDRRAAKELLVDSFHYDRDDWAWLKQSYRYFMGYAANMPPQGRLNAGQKLHHAGVVIFSASIVVSGAVMWFGKSMLGPAFFGLTVTIHDLSMVILTVLLAGHLYFTFVYRALSSMTSGYVSEEAAQLEHAKWIRELRQQESHTTHGQSQGAAD